MQTEQLESLRQELRDQIEQTKKDIVAIEKFCEPVDTGCCLDEIARSDLQVDVETNTKRKIDLISKLNKLENILINTDSPLYGFCEECGDPIPLQRLKLVPESGLCIECANEQ